MSAVTADYKVVVSGDDVLTVARLQSALNDLHAHGVPDWARVEVNAQPRGGSGWAVVAKWDPATKPPAVLRAQTVEEAEAARRQRDTRGASPIVARSLKDTPQA